MLTGSEVRVVNNLQADKIIETIKQAFDTLAAMDLPESEQECSISRESALALVAAFERIKHEKDVALEDLRDACLCRTCAHEAYCAGSIDGCEGCRKRRGCPCRAGRPDCNWQWRGVEV